METARKAEAVLLICGAVAGLHPGLGPRGNLDFHHAETHRYIKAVSVWRPSCHVSRHQAREIDKPRGVISKIRLRHGHDHLSQALTAAPSPLIVRDERGMVRPKIPERALEKPDQLK